MFGRSAKTIFILVIFAAAMVSAAYAQQASKVGVINSGEILEKSSEGKKAIAQLQAKDKQYQADVAKRDDEIRQLETKLSTQRLTLTEDALLQISTDLDKKRTDRKRISEDAQADLMNLQARLVSKLQSEVVPVIEALGKEKGFEIILDISKNVAVYWNPAIDLTAEVIKRYDASKAGAQK